jgi:hypothetical protein
MAENAFPIPQTMTGGPISEQPVVTVTISDLEGSFRSAAMMTEVSTTTSMFPLQEQRRLYNDSQTARFELHSPKPFRKCYVIMKTSNEIAGSLALLACLAFSGVRAQEAPELDLYTGKSSGPVVLLPPPMNSGDEMPAGTLHFPGREYRSGDGWWMLVCDEPRKNCTLRPARLEISAHPHPTYDGPEVPGQKLRFSPMPPAGALLVFKPFRAPANALVLAEGAVETWRIARATQTQGTMEGEFALADGRRLRFVPTLLTPPGDGERLALELTLDGQRQTLGFFGFGIDGPISLKPGDYVHWIGDLDHDGKPDFVVDFSYDGFGRDFALFLSSLAQPGEIVGLAGRFSYFPIDVAGC